MSFQPGKVLHTFTTKSGKTATLRFPFWEVLPQLLEYINLISVEDTYVRFSGEQISLKDEAEYLASIFVAMELKQRVYVYCFIDEKLAGACEVSQIPDLRARGRHVARLGITVAKDWRGDGIGYQLAKIAIETATQELSGLKMVVLECFASNTAAINLYQKLGFIEKGRLPGYLKYRGEYVDEVQMVRTLD